MKIDLSTITNNENYLEIDEDVVIPKEYIEKSNIIDLVNLHVIGNITLDHESYPDLDLVLNGTMILEDSISLEEISYPFTIEIQEKMEEKLENVTNTIDIMDILWQNILLEVPIKLTEVDDLSKYHGDGWRLVSEEELICENNPFKDLKDMLGEE